MEDNKTLQPYVNRGDASKDYHEGFVALEQLEDILVEGIDGISDANDEFQIKCGTYYGFCIRQAANMVVRAFTDSDHLPTITPEHIKQIFMLGANFHDVSDEEAHRTAIQRDTETRIN